MADHGLYFGTVDSMKVRLDVLLFERGLVESREQGQRLIQAGQVLMDNQVIDKPGVRVPSDAELRLKMTLPYVSRGGLKLSAALDAFGIDPAGKILVAFLHRYGCRQAPV